MFNDLTTKGYNFLVDASIFMSIWIIIQSKTVYTILIYIPMKKGIARTEMQKKKSLNDTTYND